MADEEKKKVTPPKPAKPDTDTVINIMHPGASITGMDGKKVPRGGSVVLPVAVCENLVEKGRARYLNKAEKGKAAPDDG